MIATTPPHTPPCGPTAGPTISNLVLAAREPPRSSTTTAAPPPAPAASPTTPPRDAEAPTLFGVFPSHLYDFPEASMVTFHQPNTKVQISDFPRRIFAKDAVVGVPVAIDGVKWSDMEAPEGSVGHVYSLAWEDREVCKVEATLKGDVLQRVVVVQSGYSPLLVAAGFSPESSLLVYGAPSAHLDAMRKLRDALKTDDELGYAPTAELVVTKALDRLELRTSHTCKGEAALRDWKTTKAFLHALSACTADCIDLYTAAEIERTKAHELREPAKAWRQHVA
jgi:hypothetical protein